MPETVVTTGLLSNEARRILTRLCEHKFEGELSTRKASPLEVLPDASTACSLIRFLRLGRDRLDLELPTVEGESIYLARDDAVELRFVWRDQLYRLPARVRRRLPSASPETPQTDTLHMHKLGPLERIQRREAYRLSLLDLPPPLISFSQSGGFSARETGSLIELAETGGRALIAKGVMTNLQESEICHVSFQLPGDEEPYEFRARVARIISSEDDILVVVGLSWRLDDSWSETRRTQARVARFIAEHQRKGRNQRV